MPCTSDPEPEPVLPDPDEYAVEDFPAQVDPASNQPPNQTIHYESNVMLVLETMQGKSFTKEEFLSTLDLLVRNAILAGTLIRTFTANRMWMFMQQRGWVLTNGDTSDPSSLRFSVVLRDPAPVARGDEDFVKRVPQGTI